MKYILFVACCLALVACGAPSAGSPTETPVAATTEQEPTTMPAPTDEPTPSPAPSAEAAITPSPSSVSISPAVTAAATPASGGPAPVPSAVESVDISIIPASVMAKLRADLIKRAGVAENEITVVSGEAVSWSDSSLGCPQPDMNYMQVITDGYRVILAAQGKEYDYRVGNNEAFLLCMK